MQRYWPLFTLRLALALVFGYFGYLGLTDPESQIGYIAPELLAISPLPATTVLLLVGVAEVAIAIAFLVGFWLNIAGYGAALLLVGIITSLIQLSGWNNEIVVRDIGLFAACLVVAASPHAFSIQPTMRRVIGWQFILYASAMIAFTAYILITKL